MRVILDANVVIAAAAARGLCEAVFEICLERCQIISCEELLHEGAKALRVKLQLPPKVADEYVLLLRDHAEVLSPIPIEPGTCRDAADDMVLGLARAGHADLIVTGDKDLLVLERFGPTRIVSPRDFWESESKKT